MFKTITGKKVYNLTGSPIRLRRQDGNFVKITVDGFAPASRSNDWRTMILNDKASFTYLDGSRHYDWYNVFTYLDESGNCDWFNVDPIEEFIPDSENGDWFAIVTVDYYIACRDMGFPTERLFTVGKPIVDDDGSIKGYKYLIKR